jgi:hypothetical protein
MKDKFLTMSKNALKTNIGASTCKVYNVSTSPSLTNQGIAWPYWYILWSRVWHTKFHFSWRILLLSFCLFWGGAQIHYLPWCTSVVVSSWWSKNDQEVENKDLQERSAIKSCYKLTVVCKWVQFLRVPLSSCLISVDSEDSSIEPSMALINISWLVTFSEGDHM